jgi:hypothetical protein
MTLYEVFMAMWAEWIRDFPAHRMGQAAYNAFHDPEVVYNVNRVPKTDPFHDDSLLPEFLAGVKEILTEKP